MYPTVSQEIDRVASTEIVEAEFVETESIVRRKPDSIKVTMDLGTWIDVDRKLHELYRLCEVAIAQRDDARTSDRNSSDRQKVAQDRLVEWKTYATKLERQIFEAQNEITALRHALERSADTADEAIAVNPLRFRRKKKLQSRIAELRNAFAQR